MKDDLVQFVFIVTALVFAAAAEDMLPVFVGTGFPLLLSLVMVTAPRVKVLPGVMTAIGAGAFEDALSSLPPMTSICFFMVVSLVSRKEYFPRPFLAAFFPAYALWAGMCMTGPMGDVFARTLVSLPLGLVSYSVTYMVLAWSGRKAGLDE